MTFETLVNIIVFVNLALTIELWRRAARRPEKLKRKFLNRLWRSKPITPKHEPPPPLKKDAWGVGKEELQFFSDFEDFANVVNSWLTDPYVHPHNSPWRLRELPKSELLMPLTDTSGPIYGRSYAVFHNQVRVGEIELEPGLNYSTQNPRVTIHVELDWVRLLPFETIRSFLTDIAEHISEYRPGTVEYVQTNWGGDKAEEGGARQVGGERGAPRKQLARIRWLCIRQRNEPRVEGGVWSRVWKSWRREVTARPPAIMGVPAATCDALGSIRALIVRGLKK